MTTIPETIKEISVSSLMKMEFPELKWMVPSLIPEGLSILSGKPKIGKSIISVNLAVAVATGGDALGKIPVEKYGVLYIALEDTPRRLQKRFRKVLKNGEPPDNLFVITSFKPIKEGGLDQLDNWLNQHEDVKFVIIDTLARIKGPSKSNGDLYREDYQSIVSIKKIADCHRIAILLIHHTRKAESEDIYDTVLGTTGITGAADTVIVLEKETHGITWHVRGRDVEEAKLTIEFDSINMGFILVGDAREYSLTNERKEIVTLLRGNGVAMKLKDIANAISKKSSNVRHLLKKLVEDGFVRQPKQGEYIIDDKPI
jgi:RecA-family ATPase